MSITERAFYCLYCSFTNCIFKKLKIFHEAPKLIFVQVAYSIHVKYSLPCHSNNRHLIKIEEKPGELT